MKTFRRGILHGVEPKRIFRREALHGEGDSQGEIFFEVGIILREATCTGGIHPHTARVPRRGRAPSTFQYCQITILFIRFEIVKRAHHICVKFTYESAPNYFFPNAMYRTYHRDMHKVSGVSTQICYKPLWKENGRVPIGLFLPGWQASHQGGNH